MALGRVFSEYFGITCQCSLHQLLHVLYSSCHRCCIVSIMTVSLNNQPIRFEIVTKRVCNTGLIITVTIRDSNYHLIYRPQDMGRSLKWSEVKWSEVKWSEVKWSETKRRELWLNEGKDLWQYLFHDCYCLIIARLFLLILLYIIVVVIVVFLFCVVCLLCV
jgi:hypothetical protein